MGLLAQDERQVIAAAESKSRELKVKLEALNVFEQVSNFLYYSEKFVHFCAKYFYFLGY